MSKFIENRQS